MIPTINTLPAFVAASPLKASRRDGECVAAGRGTGIAVTSGVGLGATGVLEGGGLGGTGVLVGVELGGTGIGVGGTVVTAAGLGETGEGAGGGTGWVESGETGVATEEETVVVGLGQAEMPVGDGTTSGPAVGCTSPPLSPSPSSSPSPRSGVMVGTVWRWGLCHGAAQA